MSLPTVASRRVDHVQLDVLSPSKSDFSSAPITPVVIPVPVPTFDANSITVQRSTLVYTFFIGAAMMVLVQWVWASTSIQFFPHLAPLYSQRQQNFVHHRDTTGSRLSTAIITPTIPQSHGRTISATDDLEAALVPPTVTEVCPVCPPVAACPVCAEPQLQTFITPTLPPSPPDTCYHISDLPGSMTPLHRQTSWSSFALSSVASCPNLGRGEWKLRDSSLPEPSWLQLDRWNMFGTRGSANDIRYEFHDECKLRRFNAESFLRAVKGKTIAFLGDSLMRQQFGMLTLLLDEAIVGSSLYYTKTARSFDPIRELHLTHDVTLKNQWLTGSHGLLRETFPTIWRSDILIVNIGAFFQSSPVEEKKFNATLLTFLDWTRKNYKGTVIWREYSATHFDTPDGEYDPTSSSDSCRPYSPSDPSHLHLTNYRVNAANAIMKEHGIPILPVFWSSLTIPKPEEAHPGKKGDCRHWFAPSSTLVQWNELLYNMLVPH